MVTASAHNTIAGIRYDLHEYQSTGQIPGIRAIEHGRDHQGY
jgi:SLT domain-containing protein